MVKKQNEKHYFVLNVSRFLSCQKADETHWIGNEMKCPEGTGFDPSLRSCNYLAYIKRCRTGEIQEGKKEEEGEGK